MFERIDYMVARLDGDYAFLKRMDKEDSEEKCVARALLPAGIDAGVKLSYEMMQYEVME